MTYPMLGLMATLASVYIALIIGFLQYLSQRKTLKTILRMQYDSVLFLKHQTDYRSNATIKCLSNRIDVQGEIDLALSAEKMGVVGRRVNKLVQDNLVEIPELVSETGK